MTGSRQAVRETGDDIGPRGKKSSTEARHQLLQARLVALAEAAIESGGLASLRARTLADAAGCSVGAIYGVFPDLDALILAVGGRTLTAMEAAMRQAGHGRNPADHLVRLALAYLDYAATHRARWRALFEHRMAGGQSVPAWYAAQQSASFMHIEAPLGALQPDLPAGERTLLARSVFAAVHGMVDLGLDEKVASMPLQVLRAQVRTIVLAVSEGLLLKKEAKTFDGCRGHDQQKFFGPFFQKRTASLNHLRRRHIVDLPRPQQRQSLDHPHHPGHRDLGRAALPGMGQQRGRAGVLSCRQQHQRLALARIRPLGHHRMLPPLATALAASASAAGMETISPAILANRLARACMVTKRCGIHRADVAGVVPAASQRLQHAGRRGRADSRASRSARAPPASRRRRSPPRHPAGSPSLAAAARPRPAGSAIGVFSASNRRRLRRPVPPPAPARRTARHTTVRVSSAAPARRRQKM